MTLTVLETLSLPGDPAKPNEDAFAVAGSAALVLDGATPLGPPLMPGPSDAAWLAQFGARRLMAHLRDGDAPDDALAHALEDAKKSFEGLRRRAVREKWELPCASMMMVKVVSDPLRPSHTTAALGADTPVRKGGLSATGTSPASADARGEGGPVLDLHFIWFGDCTAILFQEDAATVIGDGFGKRGAEAERARRLTKEKNLAPAPDLNRPEILEALRAARGHINSGGNWLFSPDPRAARHAARRTMKAAPGATLLIASDGFLALATDYGAYDAAGLMRAARTKGLAALGEELRAIEDKDALGERFARFKKSDDATALLLEIR